MRYLFVSNLADVFKLLPILAHDRRQDKSERLRIIDRCKSGTAREQQEIHIGENIGDFKITEPVLHCSEELSRTAAAHDLRDRGGESQDGSRGVARSRHLLPGRDAIHHSGGRSC